MDRVRIGAMVAAVILFGVFLYLVLSGADESRFIAVALMLVFSVLATRLNDIEKLTFGAAGLAADLSRKLEEARATVEQLQSIAELFARLSITQISSSNRWGGLTPKEKRELIADVEEGLKRIDFPTSRIKTVLDAQFRYDDYDYYNWTMEGLIYSNDDAVVSKREAFFAKFPKIRLGEAPAPEDVEQLFNDNDWNKGENRERLADWKFYRAKLSHRRRDLWEARQESGTVKELGELLAG